MSFRMNRSPKPIRIRTRERGSALVFFTFASFLLTAAVVVSLDASDRSRRHVNKDVEEFTLKNLGDSLVTMAADHLWEEFRATLGGATPTMAALQNYLDTKGVVDTAKPPPPPNTVSTAPRTQYQRSYAAAEDLKNGTVTEKTSMITTGMLFDMGVPATAAGEPT